MSLLSAIVLPMIEKHLMDAAPELIGAAVSEVEQLAQELVAWVEAKKEDPKAKS